MRLTFSVSLLVVAGAATAGAQATIREYRPEVIVTSPRARGFGAQVLAEQHLAMGDLAPNERILGLGVVSPVFLHVRAALEARQVKQPTVLEHRYIPTIYSTIPLGSGCEARNRTRGEIRDVDRTWSRRWQHRSTVGRDVAIAGTEVFTYGQFDLSYDSRFRTLNRTEKTVGFRVPVSGAASIDTFFTRQDDTRRGPHTLIVGGALLRIAL
ncbi:hypothetical protein BH11GEM1_BH11GEM1_01070 [soil metagenome]